MQKLTKLASLVFIMTVIVLASICVSQRKNLAYREDEIHRLTINQSALLSQVQYYKSENGDLVASVQALTMRRDELSELIPEYEQEIKSLRIELKNIKSIGHVEAEIDIEAVAPISEVIVPEVEHDVPVQGPTVPDNDAREFSWHDTWTDLRGRIYADSVSCRVSCRDTLTLVAHYSRRKCLFKKKGKLVKYDVKSRNPHVQINNLEIVEVVE